MAQIARRIDALPSPARALWRGAYDRIFDLGFMPTRGREAYNISLRPDTIRAVARLGARLAITIYPLNLPRVVIRLSGRRE